MLVSHGGKELESWESIFKTTEHWSENLDLHKLFCEFKTLQVALVFK